MSFGLSVPSTGKDEFDAAVDAAVESPQMVTDAGKATVQAAKDAGKTLAQLFDGDYPISMSVSGHVCEETDESSPYDYVSINVSEVAP